jgi:hypothetical protein
VIDVFKHLLAQRLVRANGNALDPPSSGHSDGGFDLSPSVSASEIAQIKAQAVRTLARQVVHTKKLKLPTDHHHAAAKELLGRWSGILLVREQVVAAVIDVLKHLLVEGLIFINGPSGFPLEKNLKRKRPDRPPFSLHHCHDVDKHDDCCNNTCTGNNKKRKQSKRYKRKTKGSPNNSSSKNSSTDHMHGDHDSVMVDFLASQVKTVVGAMMSLYQSTPILAPDLADANSGPGTLVSCTFKDCEWKNDPRQVKLWANHLEEAHSGEFHCPVAGCHATIATHDTDFRTFGTAFYVHHVSGECAGKNASW